VSQLVLPLIAFLSTIAFIVLLRPVAIRLGLTDKPDERKSHSGQVPLIGGISIFLALIVTFFSAAVLSGKSQPGADLVAFVCGGALLVVVGVLDDKRGLSPSFRLAMEVIAALIMAFGAGVVLRDVGDILPTGGTVYLGWVAVPFTVFVTVGMINSINMSDGLDGLSGNLTLVMLAALGIANSIWGQGFQIPLLNILSGAVAGFLAFNQRVFWRSKAWVFLGDAGSMMLGFALMWIVIELTQVSPRVISPAVALWFIAVPILDTATIIIRRLRQGRSPLKADAEHLHHMLIRSGFSVSQAITIICLTAAACCVVGMMFRVYWVSDFVVALSFVLTGVAYLFFMEWRWAEIKVSEVVASRSE